MSELTGACDALGYDDKDLEDYARGNRPQPWKCERPYGHDGDHDMPYLRDTFGEAQTKARLEGLEWFMPDEEVKA